MTPEAKVKSEALKLYKKHGVKYDRAAQNGMGRNGRADDIVCRNGHFIGIEAKKLDVAKVTKLQQIWLDDCVNCGGSSMVLNAENLWLLDKVLSSSAYRITAMFAPAKEGATCTGHTVEWPGYTKFVPMTDKSM